METPYIPHHFGAEAVAKTRGHEGWLTAGVVSSIPWPSDDVWVYYDSEEYFLHGVKRDGEQLNSPCISTPITGADTDGALSRLYRFTSILGYFKRGYVDITESFSSGYLMRYGDHHGSFTTLTQAGKKSFDCNYMPVLVDDQVRKALAFLREGRRLRRVHEPYSFLSFFKVIESQLPSRDRVQWIEQTLDRLGGDAAKRVMELRTDGVDVNDHLFQSGRCAVAHASLGGTIVDPDIPSDRRRIAADIEIISALADYYIGVEAGVPDEMDLYRSRDRVQPWHRLMAPQAVTALKAGGRIERAEDLGRLNKASVSIRLWPDPPPDQFREMEFLPTECCGGAVKFVALNSRKTIALVFAMDVAHGRFHTILDEGGVGAGMDTTEQDIEDFTRYFHSVIANRVVELAIDGVEPVPCEVVIPTNIIPQAPEEAVARAIAQFRLERGMTSSAGADDVGLPKSPGGAQNGNRSVD